MKENFDWAKQTEVVGKDVSIKDSLCSDYYSDSCEEEQWVKKSFKKKYLIKVSMWLFLCFALFLISF